MANELKNARAGLKTRLETISALKRVYDYAPETVSEDPAAVIMLDGTDNKRLVGGSTFTADFRVTVYVHAGRVSEAMTDLDDMASPLGAKSLEAAVDADPTWDSKVDYGILLRTERQRRLEAPGGQDYFAQDWIFRATVKVTT